MKPETLAAKKCTFLRKGLILLAACCGEKVLIPEAKKCTFQRKGLTLLVACCGGKVHIRKEKFDFACCLLVACLLLVAK